MNIKHDDEITQKAITDAWDFYISQHLVSIPEIVECAIKDAWDTWLSSHADQIIERIAQKQVDHEKGPWIELLCVDCFSRLTQ